MMLALGANTKSNPLVLKYQDNCSELFPNFVGNQSLSFRNIHVHVHEMRILNKFLNNSTFTYWMMNCEKILTMAQILFNYIDSMRRD